MAGQPLDNAHFKAVIDAIINGRLIPFFGAGVNQCDRPLATEEEWELDSPFLPTGRELSRHLAGEYSCPTASDQLARVCQFIAIRAGETALDRRMHGILRQTYATTSLHRFFAGLPRLLGARDCPEKHLLIITTNYDNLMEDALEERNEPYDVVSCIRSGSYRGRFLHYGHSTPTPQIIKRSNSYDRVSIEQTSVVLKIHGAVLDKAIVDAVPKVPEYNFVLTEDNYIEFLSHGDIIRNIPVLLRQEFNDGQFLFLGYSLSDWNMRAFLNAVQEKQRSLHRKLRSWAIQLSPDPVEISFWKNRDVDIHDSHLDEYVRELKKRLQDSVGD